jgi:hypothetical protein
METSLMNTRNLLGCAALVCLFAQTAHAHTSIYTTILNGPNEFPANPSLGVGAAKLTVDFDLLAMRVEANFSGLTGNTTAAHIHGPIPDPPANPLAGVATPLPSFPGFPLGVQAGSYDQTFDMTAASSYNPAFVTANGGTVGSAMNVFFAGLDAGKMYLNIHTTNTQGGEIRGFFELVPEPSTLSLMALGLLTPLVCRARRRMAA